MKYLWIGLFYYILCFRVNATHNLAYFRKCEVTMSRGLDGRYRDEAGEIRRKNGNTLVRTLREEYGDDFAQGYRSDTKLENLLERERASSLSELLRRNRR